MSPDGLFKIAESGRSALLVDEDGTGHRFERTIPSGPKVRHVAVCGQLIDPKVGALRPRADFSPAHPESCEACR